MLKIFRAINKRIRTVINILVRLVLGFVYFILLLPFAVFIKLFTDYLENNKRPPYWVAHSKIEDVKKFLTRQ
jgi:hypothetical protein